MIGYFEMYNNPAHRQNACTTKTRIAFDVVLDLISEMHRCTKFARLLTLHNFIIVYTKL